MRKLFIQSLILTSVVSGCAMTATEMVSAPSARLCEFYSHPGSPQYLDPTIKAELERRGQADCISPEILVLRANAYQNSMQMLNLSTPLMQMGTPRPVTVTPTNTFPKTTNCVSRIQGNQLVTTCN